jgi:hypothetical protein
MERDGWCLNQMSAARKLILPRRKLLLPQRPCFNPWVWIPKRVQPTCAVALDATGTLAFASASLGPLDDTSLTVGAGTNRALVVCAIYGSAITVIFHWDFGGTNQLMTSIKKSSNGGGLNVELFGLIAPTSGNKTLRATWVNSTDFKFCAISWTGVDQTGGSTSFPNSVATSGTSATPSSGAVTSATGNACVAVVANAGNNAQAGANQTEYFNDTQGSFNVAGQRAAGAASVTLSWSNGGSDVWAEAATDILASGGAAFTAKFRRTLSSLGIRVGSRQPHGWR